MSTQITFVIYVFAQNEADILVVSDSLTFEITEVQQDFETYIPHFAPLFETKPDDVVIEAPALIQLP